MKIKKLSLVLLVFGAVLIAHAEPKPPANKTGGVSPVPANAGMRDPFFRGLNRSPQYNSLRSGAISNYSRLDDLRMLQDVRYYRILSLYEEAKSTADVPLYQAKSKTTKTQNGFYLFLGTYPAQWQARQQALDFIANNALLINHSVLIRDSVKDKKKVFSLEYGPFKSLELAQATCFYILHNTSQFNLSCDQSEKHPISNDNRLRKPNSATVGLSQAAILEYSRQAMGFDPTALSETSLLVREGELLGPQDFYVVRINHLGIHLASPNGEVATIPAVTLPIYVEALANERRAATGEPPASSTAIPAPPPATVNPPEATAKPK